MDAVGRSRFGSLGEAARLRPRRSFVATLLALQAAKLAVSLVAAHLLAPTEFADWGRLLLILQYSAYAQLGATMAIHREFPIRLGAGDEAAARRLSGAALVAATVGPTLLVVLALDLSSDQLLRTAAFALLPLLTALTLLNQAVLRSLNKFSVASRLLALEGVGWASVVLGALLWRESLDFVVAIDVVLLLVLVVGMRATRSWFGRFRGRDATLLLRSGVPLSVSAAVATLRQTGDMLVANWRSTPTMFAALALGATFLRVLYFLPTLTSMLWYPDLGRAFGGGGSPALHERTRSILTRYVPVTTVAALAVTAASAAALSIGLGNYRELRTLILVKVGAEGLAMTASVCVLAFAVARRIRFVVLANAVGLLPFVVLVVTGSTSERDLQLAIVASSVSYTTIVFGIYLAKARTGRW